jgi:ATP-dependent Clp protease, protease subunit
MTIPLDPLAGLDDELYRRLLTHRTIVLGEPLEDRNSNRLCHALLLLAADDPKADIRMPHAKVLLHQGSAGIGGTAMDIAIQADDLRHTRGTVLACIAEDTGQPVERVEEDSRRDR